MLKKDYTTVPLIHGDMFQDSQWMAETVGNIKPYEYSFFLYIHTYDTV